MKFFIVDDHIQIIRVVENIIEDAELGTVIDHCTDSKLALKKIQDQSPDIVIVDFLMPGLDGTELVSQIKQVKPHIKFIMLSQVSTKELIEKAYSAGVEFFIAKPINQLEVTRVIKNIMKQIELSRKFEAMKTLLGDPHEGYARPLYQAAPSQEENCKAILSKIGIMGEAGADDLLQLTHYFVSHPKEQRGMRINEVCAHLSSQPKAMEQRIRRAINKGLVNLANLGIEDYMHETFTTYSSSLYDFESVKAEMDYIRGQKSSGGKISVKKFVDNLLLHAQAK